LPSGLLIPYLLFAIVTVLSVNTADLYSSGLSLQTLGVKLKRWQCVMVDLVICFGLTIVVLFSSSFNTFFSDFRSLLILWLAPWFGIYATDFLMRRNQYDNAALQNKSGGSYWYTKGFSIPGIVAMVVGMAASAMWINNPVLVGPLSRVTGGSDLSVFTGVLVAAGVYYVLKRLVANSDKVAVAASSPDLKDAGAIPATAVGLGAVANAASKVDSSASDFVRSNGTDIDDVLDPA
jgi:purine-cytosine permease-like protein